MNKISLIDFLDPFENMTQFNKALSIIQKTYSIKTNNINDVTQIVNQSLNIYRSPFVISQFISRINTNPNFYGLDYVANSSSFEKSLVSICERLKIPSTVLTPDISNCFLCQSNGLIIKQTDFNKNPTLFRLNFIGNFNFAIMCN